LPGGLAVATVGGCAGFGAVCGESLATVITMSAVALPAMRENNYDLSLATGSLAAGGTLGILIPPSIGFIIYSMITEESVGKLFAAGVLPGILLTAIFMTIIILVVKRRPEIAPLSPVYPLKDKISSLISLIPVIALFLVVVIGILNGWFTPAEGGALGAVLGFLYALLRRKMTAKSFWETMQRSTAMFGKIFAMFIGLKVLGAFLATSRLPNVLADAVVSLHVSPYLVLTAIILMYVLLGCVMNIMPMMMLTLPSIFPTVQAMGFDGVWFGVVLVIVMEMGQITPPVGVNVYMLASLHPEISTGTIYKGVLPFFLGMILCIFLVVCFPQIALFLLN
ncbi:MAG: TRAP transporter large permease, partial [Mailhella sp.]|nr:TRAP transporter large permease [Mailhella sp.]